MYVTHSLYYGLLEIFITNEAYVDNKEQDKSEDSNISKCYPLHQNELADIQFLA